jgi:hypothetical protein
VQARVEFWNLCVDEISFKTVLVLTEASAHSSANALRTTYYAGRLTLTSLDEISSHPSFAIQEGEQSSATQERLDERAPPRMDEERRATP